MPRRHEPAALFRHRRALIASPSRIALGLVPILAASHLALPAFGQGGRQPPAASFQETVEVKVVNLEVVVTDREGRRVTDLSKEDFVLWVDGEPVPILHFSEQGRAGSGARDAGRGTSGLGSPDRQPGVSFLLFVDDHVTLKRRRDTALLRLRRELPVLQANDRLAVVSYDGRRMRVLLPWSSSLEVIDEALAAAMTRPAEGIKWVALARMPGFISNWIGNATRRSILAAASSMRILPTPSGRKVLLLVAGSWDPKEVARAESFSPWCMSGPCFGNFVLTALTDTANQLGYSIYAADVEGRDVQQDWAREKRLEATLAMVTGATGGRALFHKDRNRMLSIVSADSRSYYSLGFRPREPEANRRHHVTVEVRHPGLKTRTRESFVAVTRRRAHDLEALSALLGGVDARYVTFPVELEEPERLPARRMRLPVSVFAPVGELTWLVEGESYAARLEVQLAAVDARGNSSAVENHEVRIEQVAPASAGELEHLEFVLELPRRRHTIAVLVRDLQAEAVFTAVVEISPPTAWK